MASTTDKKTNVDQIPSHDTFNIESSSSNNSWKTVQTILKPLASLKLTVVLFGAAIFIVLAGTFAQVHDDIWTVVNEYFRVDLGRLITSSSLPLINLGELFVWVDADLFFPESFFPPNPTFPDNLNWMAAIWPDGSKNLPDNFGIYFPKGWTIGILMGLNLLAAHTVRFKVQASGTRLIVGSVILGLGTLFTYLVILSGSSENGLQSNPILSYDTLRLIMLTTLCGLTGATIYGTFALGPKEQKWLSGIGAILLALTAVFTAYWEANDEASMRILYQLVKATLASVILLVGCIAVFKRRAGIVLLHAGIGLMMFYDVLVGVQHVESQMTIIEGETSNFSRDIREVEFAVIDHSGQDEDLETVVSQSLLQQSEKSGTDISSPKLPFDMKVVKFYRNSDVRGLRSFGPNEKIPENDATEGVGKSVVAVPADNVKGTDTGGSVDIPSLYVTLKSKDGKELGTWLTSSIFDLSDSNFGRAQTVRVGNKTYDIALRYVRLYYDFSITLDDVQKNDYKGTSKVKDYSSYITLNKPSEDLKFEHRIWMNNPMRFAGKTFYQSNYGLVEGNREFTTLQVVDNAGWMTPYVSCMIVWVGMMFHFGQTLLRYLGRRAKSSNTAPRASIANKWKPASALDVAGWITAGVLSVGILLSVMMAGRAPREKPGEFHIATFGELPMWNKGRSMPIDSFARNALLKLSDYETYRDEDGKKHPASEWLLQIMTGKESSRDVRVFKIENKEVIEALGLEDRKRFTYSFNELLNSREVDGIKEMGMLTILRDLEGLTNLDPQKPRDFKVAASDTPPNERSLFERKIIELSNKIESYVLLEFTVGGGRIIDLMRAKDDSAQAMSPALELRSKITEFDRLHQEAFRNVPIALIVPTHIDDKMGTDDDEPGTDWESVTRAMVFSKAYDALLSVGDEAFSKPPAMELFLSMIDAYGAGDVEKFNTDLAKYQQVLASYPHTGEDANIMNKTEFEAIYNRFDAFYVAGTLYVFAGILAAFGWLFLPQVFQRSAFWVLCTVFIIHTVALIGRIYISGRPPVTNLYSSAIFIGWAVVLGSIILEMVSKLGVANLVGAAAGFMTLRIADGLASDGDTFVVLEAVLDTQFWLATHVVCITLGYSTTYLAGLLGIIYLMMGIFTPSLNKNMSKEITRMTYGVLCFATFFSFIGTVLGGLWADDSWGRFWGWDPKENGALIIVLWNALVLHARWGNLVKDRGIAVLAVLGNAVVSWSWFGVNELGVGLHSYGFTEGRLAWLALFVASQITIAAIGCTPKSVWRSRDSELPETNELA
ncbi:cytochrome c biogenesis protein CcsA [Thalassoglobus sp.]|uniref:cytochrome c biogenesis protein n=1 Tax=Thalassoglobus sp. TaxID=2795869 RepID=UPI003AA99398